MKLAIIGDGGQRRAIEQEVAEAGHQLKWITRERIQELSPTHGEFDLAMVIAPFNKTDNHCLSDLRRRLPEDLPLVVTDPDHLGVVLSKMGPGAPVSSTRMSRECRVLKAVAVHKDVLDCPPYRLDLTKAQAWIGEEKPGLTPREFDLAVCLFSRPNQLLEREFLLEAVWGYGENVVTRTLDTHMSRLRTKMRLTGHHGWMLKSIYQRGYRLECPGPDDCPSPR